MPDRKRISIGIASTLCAAVLSGCGIGSASVPATASQPAALPVEIQVASRGHIAAVYTATATLEALDEAVVTARVDGEIEALLVEEGQPVRAGQVLARLDGERLRLELRRTETRLASMERDLERQQRLLQRDLAASEAVEQLAFDVRAERAAVELARLELSYTEIRAPIDGVVSERFVKTGVTVAAGADCFRVTGLEKLRVRLHVPQGELQKLTPGQTVVLRADALGRERFAGRVERISPVIDPRSGTFGVTVDVLDRSGALRPGMFARVEIAYDDRDDVVLIPREALLREDVETAVYVVESGIAHRRVISTGHANGDVVEVTGGLEAGEALVTVGQTGLRDGAPVAVTGPELLASSRS